MNTKEIRGINLRLIKPYVTVSGDYIGEHCTVNMKMKIGILGQVANPHVEV